MHIDVTFPVRLIVSWILRKIARPGIVISKRGVNIGVVVRNRGFHNFQIESMRLVAKGGMSYQIIGDPRLSTASQLISYKAEPASKRENPLFGSGESATYYLYTLLVESELKGKLVCVEIIAGSGRCTRSKDLYF